MTKPALYKDLESDTLESAHTLAHKWKVPVRRAREMLKKYIQDGRIEPYISFEKRNGIKRKNDEHNNLS